MNRTITKTMEITRKKSLLGVKYNVAWGYRPTGLETQPLTQGPAGIRAWVSRWRGFSALGLVTMILQHLVKLLCLLIGDPKSSIKTKDLKLWRVIQIFTVGMSQRLDQVHWPSWVESSLLRPPPPRVIKSTKQKRWKKQLWNFSFLCLGYMSIICIK